MRILLVIVALLPGFASGADVAPITSSIQCFEQEVRIESVCQPVGSGPVFNTCRRQTLRIGKRAVELPGKDNSMVAQEWACSADQKTLFVMQANGGNCPECEKQLVFDKDGRQVRKNGHQRPNWRSIDVLPPAQ